MSFEITETSLPGVLVLEPRIFSDSRGFFFESFNKRDFQVATGLNVDFVQDNHSQSARGVLRGLHYQIQRPQGKLVRVTEGAVFDVAVDLRRSSRFFGQYVGVELSESNKRQLWIPVGFAHGFVVISDTAQVLYKATDYWYPEHERSLLWSDSTVGVKWPIKGVPMLSGKDAAAKPMAELDLFD